MLLAAASDVLLVWIGLNVATLARMHTLPEVDLLLLQRDRCVILLLYLVSGGVAGAFDPLRLTDRFDSIYYAGMTLVSTGVLAFLSVALLPQDFMAISRREIGLGLLIAAPVLTVWRFWATEIAMRFGALFRAFYVLGAPEDGARIARALNDRPDVLAEATYIDAGARTIQFPEDVPPDAHPRFDAIICLTDKSSEAFLDLITFCENHCRRTFVYPSIYDTLMFQHSRLLAIGGLPLIQLATRRPVGAYVKIKRFIDFLVAFAGIVLASPLCLVAAVAVKTSSPGGVFYTQERVGLGGQTFKIIKFRTMVKDAEAETGSVWAEKDDARVTPAGRFLRRHRIDEIPQLLNVLKGDMSLVGPRPERPHFHTVFSQELPLFERRILVRPGMTSLSHVLGSYDSAPADRLRYDLVYIGTLSLLTDLRILVSTIRIVLSGRGAH